MFNISKKLIENENKDSINRKKVVDSVIQKVEKLLIKNNFTLGEWSKIIDHFNNKSQITITSFPIEKLDRK